MVGSPKKRARRAEQEAAKLREQLPGEAVKPDIPNAIPTGPEIDARAQYARAGSQAHARERGRRAAMPRAAMSPGPELRATVDRMQAGEIAKLAQALRPGLFLTIERLRPSWCAGWVEDYELQDAQVGELFEYISDEYGGNLYRVLVASPDGQPYYETRIKIAGPPKNQGRLIDRAKWEGRQADDQVLTPARANGNGGDQTGALIGALAGMFQAVLEANNRTADKTMEAVRTLNESQQKTTADLIGTIVQARENSQERGSFVSQLREVAQANEALKEVKDALREPGAEGQADEGSLMNSALQGAAAQFMSAVMQSKLAGKNGGKGPRRHTRRRPLDVPPAISDSRISGLKHGARKSEN